MANKTNFLNWSSSLISKVSVFFGYISGALVFFMMLIIVYDVFMRHVFGDPTIWADEISGYLLVGVTYLGAAYTLRNHGHIRVDAVIGLLSTKTQKRLNLVTDVLTLVFFVILSFYVYRLIFMSFVSDKITATLLRTPVFIPQLLILVGITWFCLQLVVSIMKSGQDKRNL